MKTILFTGATSGLGLISALKAASEGHHLIILARKKDSDIKFKRQFQEKYGDTPFKTDFILCDLSSIESVQNALKEVKNKYEHLDILVNNAGMWNSNFNETSDGFEETYQVNLLIPIFILENLIPLLNKADKPKYIITSSGLHQGSINFNDIEFRKAWSGFKAYRQSKLGVILMCRLFAVNQPQITFCSQHPGVVRTNLGNKFGWFSRAIFYIIGKSAEKGSRTLSYLIETPADELQSGEYYANSKVTKTTKESNDLELAQKLKAAIDKDLDRF